MADDIIIYEKPTCSTCRAAASMLLKKGVSFVRVRYYDEPLSEAKLKSLIWKMGITPRELLRTKEPVYKKLKLSTAKKTDAELIRLMIRYPDLMQRPILEKGNIAVLGRPETRITEFLKNL
jgi:arsenate reductase